MERLESDMDDLFLKAGELYPLKISEPDWQGVSGKIQNENFGDPNTVPGLAARGVRQKRRWLLLLMLIPAGLGGLIYTSRSIDKLQRIPAIPVVKNIPDTRLNSTKNNPAGTEQIIKNDNPAAISGTENSFAKTHKSNPGSQNKNNPYSKNYTPPVIADAVSKPDYPDGDASPFGQESPEIQLAKPLSLTTVSGSDHPITIQGIPIASPSVEMNADLKSKKATPATLPAKGFYVELLGGPDLSMVKFQSVNQLGFSVGALVGYRFLKNLALETGVLWDKKYYYSKGDYFNKKQAGIPYNILTLDGNCSMFEIPINLRYDFGDRNHHGFFAKAGLSSYFMKNESYSYVAERYGNHWEGDTTYNNASKNYFSILQLSAGYELAVSRKTKISIEPYVKIPMVGIGIGGMPISSAGLYLGIIHSFR